MLLLMVVSGALHGVLARPLGCSGWTRQHLRVISSGCYGRDRKRDKREGEAMYVRVRVRVRVRVSLSLCDCLFVALNTRTHTHFLSLVHTEDQTPNLGSVGFLSCQWRAGGGGI